jgi:hypothetical protein
VEGPVVAVVGGFAQPAMMIAKAGAPDSSVGMAVTGSVAPKTSDNTRTATHPTAPTSDATIGHFMAGKRRADMIGCSPIGPVRR